MFRLTLLMLTSFLLPISSLVKATNSDQISSELIEKTHRIEIWVDLPTDAPKDIYLTGNLPQLGPWRPADFKMNGTGNKRQAVLEVPHGFELEFKITAGSWEQEGLGPSGTMLPNFKLLADQDKSTTVKIEGFRKDPVELIKDWQGSGVEGEIIYWQDVESSKLKEPRHVLIWLPPGYEQNRETPYPVIYTHDGQNLFDPRLSYTNVDWGLDEAIVKGVEAGEYTPPVIVGIWNTADRLWEYSPWHDADNYAEFIIEELMPRINKEFNVAQTPDKTFSMGSSMGGLVSFYLVAKYPEYFSACGCLSTHVTWSPQMATYMQGGDAASASSTPYLAQYLEENSELKPDPSKARFYFDYGTEGLDSFYAPTTIQMEQWLKNQGFQSEQNLKVKEFPGADHSETAWRARVGEQLRWMMNDQ
ncbi:MAG: alpha/beta hydrolase-fold protein [Pseudomonadota bacterium]